MNAHNEQQPAAAQEAVVGVIDDMKIHHDGSGYVAVCWQRVPDGFKLGQAACVVAPVTAAPADTWFADQLTAMGDVIPLDGTPAAPGIDLYPIRCALQYAAAAARENTHTEMAEGFDALIRKIDASPKTFQPTRTYSLDILGNPMRQYEPGKWESARWPSDASPKGDESQQAAAQAIAIVHMDGYRWNGQHWQKDSPQGALNEQFGSAEGLGSPKGGSDLIACVDRIEEAIEHRVPHEIYGKVHVELAEIRRLAQDGDAEVQP